MSYLKAIEAEVDVVDTANAAFIPGLQPAPTDSIVAACIIPPMIPVWAWNFLNRRLFQGDQPLQYPRDILGVNTMCSVTNPRV